MLVLPLVLAGSTLWTCFAGQDTRAPVPAPDAQKAAEKLVREVFKEEYAKRAAADRLGLARKLLEQSVQSSGEPATQYVMLREAQELAAQGGDAALAIQGIDALSKVFQVNAVALKQAALSSIAKTARLPEEMKALAVSFLKLADEAMVADDHETADKSADSAGTVARKSKEMALAARADSLKKELAARKARYEKVKKAKETLAKTPDDADANHALGHYLCSVKSDWESGLAHLAKGSVAPMKSQAQRDLSDPKDSGEQAAVGDGWWELAEREEESTRLAFRRRAAHWYERAASALSGLVRTKIEKRLLEVREAQFGPKHLWTALADPKQFGLSGIPGEPITLVAVEAKTAYLKALPPGDWNGVSVRVRFDNAPRSHGGLLFESNDRITYVDNNGDAFMSCHLAGGRWVRDAEVLIDKRTEYVITVLIVPGEYVLYLDGKEMARLPTNKTKLLEIGLQASFGPATFDQIRIRRKD